jgi:hypothetical protein
MSQGKFEMKIFEKIIILKFELKFLFLNFEKENGHRKWKN